MLNYVLNNAHKHGALKPGVPDPFSSAPSFAIRASEHGSELDALAAGDHTYDLVHLPHASTWLLRQGWREYGPLDVQGRATARGWAFTSR